MVSFKVNGAPQRVDAPPETPLLWVLRERLLLNGAKYGCGIGACGACTIIVEGEALRACTTPLSFVTGKEVRTVEGLAEDHPVVAAWIAEEVPQCGFCQPGQIMSAVALLDRTPHPDDAAIENALDGNLCRCGTYLRIRRAVRRAAGLMEERAIERLARR